MPVVLCMVFDLIFHIFLIFVAAFIRICAGYYELSEESEWDGMTWDLWEIRLAWTQYAVDTGQM